VGERTGRNEFRTLNAYTAIEGLLVTTVRSAQRSADVRPALAWVALLSATAAFAGHVALAARSPQENVLGSALIDVSTNLGYLAFAFVGTLVVSRRHGHRIGWLFVFVGLTYSLVWLVDRIGLEALRTPGEPPVLLMWLGSWAWLVPDIVSTTLLVLLFPDGRPPSRAWRPALWLGVVSVVAAPLWFMVRPGPLWEPFVEIANPLGIAGLTELADVVTNATFALWLLAAGAAVLGLIARFRRARGVERQQLKWFAYGASVLFALVAFVGLLIGLYGVGAFANINAVIGVAIPLAVGAVPTCAGIAILRHRLYDIDLLISRTLVYGSLSGALAASYVAFVVLLQSALSPVTGGSEIAVAASTLATLVLVQPLRRRIQSEVDRRFYRSRYDAVRTVDAFAGRLRDQVDLDELSADLLEVVLETVHPAHARVWLRSEEGRSTAGGPGAGPTGKRTAARGVGMGA